MKKFILFVVIVAVAGGGYYYYNLSNTQVSTTSYEYIKVEKGNIKKTVSATGKIIPTSTLTLSSEISGKIVKINKDFNEQIEIGEVLATFDQNPFILRVEETETSASELSSRTLPLLKKFRKLSVLMLGRVLQALYHHQFSSHL